MSTFSDYIRSTLWIYGESIKSATRGIIRNWIIVLGSIGLYGVLLIASALLAPLGMLGGLFLGVIQIALLSLYYSWLSQTVDKDKLSWKGLIQFDLGLFFIVISVAFILSIADLLFVQALGRAESLEWLPRVFSLVLFLVFNSLPEVIHQHRIESIPAFGKAFEFNKESWIEWHLPLLLFLSPIIILISPMGALSLIVGAQVLLPVLVVMSATSLFLPDISFITGLLALFIGHWYMLFRAHLFKELEGGTRRRRAFLIKQRT